LQMTENIPHCSGCCDRENIPHCRWQCSNMLEFSTRVLLCPTGSLAWAGDRAGLTGFSPAHMSRIGSNPNLNVLNRVWPNKIKKNPIKFHIYCVLFEKLVLNIIQWHYSN
jgi:hypothetical protein